MRDHGGEHLACGRLVVVSFSFKMTMFRRNLLFPFTQRHKQEDQG
jgi:hypothetical protein